MADYRERLTTAFASRSYRERVLMLVVMLVVIASLWLVLVQDPMTANRATLRAQLESIEAQVAGQRARLEALLATRQEDPDALARARAAELEQDNAEIDGRLSRRYRQFMSAPEMTDLLVSILRSETGLRLLSLENTRPQRVFESEPAQAGVAPLTIWRHGLVMEMQGGYLETLRYLRSIEDLGNHFYWGGLDYELETHPQGRVVLRLFTLSNEEKWIGG